MSISISSVLNWSRFRLNVTNSSQNDSLLLSRTQLETCQQQVGQLTAERAHQDSEIKLLQKRLSDATVCIFQIFLKV